MGSSPTLLPFTGFLTLWRGQLEGAQRGKCGHMDHSCAERAADAPGRAVTPSLPAFLHPLLFSVSIGWDLYKLPKTIGLPL